MSGIYIKGMEMPKEDEISKCFLIRHDGEVWVVEFDNLISDLGYVACYPTNPAKAIPVPDHGRLCNKDDVLKVIDNLIGRIANKEAYEALKWAKDCLSVLPTIIPASGGKENEF